ncbi:MAG: molybdopterin converting factor subunit 1 [Lysobacteraceae bacterium]
MRIEVLYFASLRDVTGVDRESVDMADGDAAQLFQQLNAKHGFTLPRERLRVAINSEFADWHRPLADGDEVAFIPPVSGG